MRVRLTAELAPAMEWGVNAKRYQPYSCSRLTGVRWRQKRLETGEVIAGEARHTAKHPADERVRG